MLLSTERFNLVLSLLKLLLYNRQLASFRLGLAELSLQRRDVGLVLGDLLVQVLLLIAKLVLDLADLLRQQSNLRLVLSLALLQLLAGSLGHGQRAFDLIKLVLQPLLVRFQVLDAEKLLFGVATRLCDLVLECHDVFVEPLLLLEQSLDLSLLLVSIRLQLVVLFLDDL